MIQNHYPSIAVILIQDEHPPIQAAVFVNGVYIKGAGDGVNTGEVYQMAKVLSGALREPVEYATIQADEVQGPTAHGPDGALGYAEAFGIAYRQGRFASAEESDPEVSRNKILLAAQVASTNAA